MIANPCMGFNMLISDALKSIGLKCFHFFQEKALGVADFQRLWCRLRSGRLQCWNNPSEADCKGALLFVSLQKVRIRLNKKFFCLFCSFKTALNIFCPLKGSAKFNDLGWHDETWSWIVSFYEVFSCHVKLTCHIAWFRQMTFLKYGLRCFSHKL